MDSDRVRELWAHISHINSTGSVVIGTHASQYSSMQEH